MSEEQKIKARERAKKYYYEHKEKVAEKNKKYTKEKLANDKDFRERINASKRRWARKHYIELREKGLLKKTKQQRLDDIEKYIRYWNKKGINETTMLILNDILLIINGNSDMVERLKK